MPLKGDVDKQLEKIKERLLFIRMPQATNQKKVSLLIAQNKYGDLLNDDSLLNKRYSIWIPVAQVLATNAFV
jgi:hypothetical protein